MTLAYERHGSGEPLLLVHGLGGVGRYWDALVPRLVDHYDVIVIDLPGFGGSPALPGREVPAAALAEAVAGQLDELGLDSVHVMGHSLGGVVAFELGALGRARTITGLAPAGLWAGAEQAGWSKARLRASHLFAATTRPVARPFIRLATRLPVARLPYGLSPEAALALYDSYSSAPGFEPVLRGVSTTPFTKGDRLTMPVTVVFGARDTVIIAADRNRDRLPAHTRWVELAGAGHNVPWERSRDIVRTVIETTGGRHERQH